MRIPVPARWLLRSVALLLLSLGFLPGGRGVLPGPGRPPAAVPALDAGWPMYGADSTHASYRAGDPILVPSNVASLVSRWQQPIGSGGTWPSSTPIIANGRVYTGGGFTSGANFLAFDAVQGSPVWSTTVGHASSCLGVGIGATPAISGTTLVAGGGDAAYYGINADTGAILWRHALNVGPSGFAWASPLIQGTHAYIGVASGCDNPQIRGELRMLDLQTGVQLANAYFVPPDHTGASIWNSPALSPDGQTLVVATGEDQEAGDPYTRAIVTLDPATLAILQANQQGSAGADLDEATSPTIFADSQGRTLVAAGHKDGTLYAYLLGAVGAGPVWSVPQQAATGLLLAFDSGLGPGGALLYGTTDGTIHAVDAASGAALWTSAPLGTIHGNLAITNGLLFANTGVAGLQILDETSGTLLRTLLPLNAGGSNSGVALAGGFIYWIAGNELNAWSLAGSPLTPPVPTPTPPGADGCVFVDVCSGDYYYAGVAYLKVSGAVSGYVDNTFRPYNLTTRAHLAKILVTAFNITPFTGHPQTFADVPDTQPFYAVIETAAKEHMISGYACGGVGEPCDSLNRPYFRPSAEVTRGQVAKMSAGAAGWPLITPVTPTFADVPANYALYSAIETAVCHGALSGYACGGPGEPCDSQNRPYFHPGASATRGQVCKIVFNVIRSAGCAPAAP